MQTSGTLQRELKQKRAFVSVQQEATVAILRTADLTRRLMSMALESSAITGQQFNVLRILRGAGPDGLPTLDYDVGTHFSDPEPSSGGPTVTDALERVKTYQQYIGGQWVDSAVGDTIDVEDLPGGVGQGFRLALLMREILRFHERSDFERTELSFGAHLLVQAARLKGNVGQGSDGRRRSLAE